MNIIKEAYQKSIDLLKVLSTSEGFIASPEERANYHRVWSRDATIAGLASLSGNEKILIEVFKETLLNLKKNQDKTGRIPSNISLDGGDVSYGTNVGRVDATLWYIIGVCQYFLHTKDEVFFKEINPSLKKAFFYLNCLELNGRGLIYIPQGGDWADEYINHGYVLFDQMLYLISLRNYGYITKDKEIKEKERKLRKLIKINYFPYEENLNNKYVYNPVLFQESLNKKKGDISVLSYFTGHSVLFHTDNFANSLVFLEELLEPNERLLLKKKIIKEANLKEESPLIPAFYPVIKEKDALWKNLRNNYVFQFRNYPYRYHNGGLWPLVHGFFLSTFEGREGKKYLNDFAKVLKKDDYIFPEYYNGLTYDPCGVKKLGYSASAYILAYNSIINKRKPFLWK